MDEARLSCTGCVPGLTIFMLQTMQVKSFDWKILKVRTIRTFIQNLAKERPVTRVDPDVEIELALFMQSPFCWLKHIDK